MRLGEKCVVLKAAGAPFCMPKLDHRNDATACQKQGGKEERGGRSTGQRVRGRWGVRGQARGAMRDSHARGGGGSPDTGCRNVDARSFATAGALREVVPPPPCHGESNPDP